MYIDWLVVQSHSTDVKAIFACDEFFNKATLKHGNWISGNLESINQRKQDLQICENYTA